MEAVCVVPKRTGQTPVRSLPRKENGKARTWMDEKSVRKSHGHHIPPAKGMGERALLLLGLLSLLTAADEVRHADAQHRATSDPSEGHAVKAGQREAGALLVDDGEAELTDRYSGRIGLYNTISSSNVGRILVGSHRGAILLKRAASNGKRDTFGSRVVVARRRGYLCEGVGALIETDNVYLTVCVGLQLGLLAISRLGTVRFDKVARITVLLQRELVWA